MSHKQKAEQNHALQVANISIWRYPSRCV
jgi:hypothetical protein